MQATFMTKVAELYGLPTFQDANWQSVVNDQNCPFLNRKCLKNRKSEADLTIGTCTMHYGNAGPVMICPFRLLEHRKIFTDCIHLLALHEPGNDLRIMSEISVPGGNIDYFLISAKNGRVKDFVGIELQTLDTSGTVWPERQRFLKSHGVVVDEDYAQSGKPFGMNWKMTAKTILVQLNHKIETFDHLGKHLVLVVQDQLLSYMKRGFAFGHINGVRTGDPMHFHSYQMKQNPTHYELQLVERLSTDAIGVAQCLGLKKDARLELTTLIGQLESKLPKSTLLTLGEQ